MNKVYDVKNLKVTTKTISFDLSGKLIMVPLNKSGSTVLSSGSQAPSNL